VAGERPSKKICKNWIQIIAAIAIGSSKLPSDYLIHAFSKPSIKVNTLPAIHPTCDPHPRDAFRDTLVRGFSSISRSQLGQLKKWKYL
jgi:hypothetical protein